MKLFGSTEKKIIKDKNGENVPHLEIAKVTRITEKSQESCIHLFQINCLVYYQKFYRQVLPF